MKTAISILAAITIILIMSANQNYDNNKVNLMELGDKEFKYIFKFDENTTAKEFEDAELFLKQYHSAIDISFSTNSIDNTKALRIKGENVSCESSDFKYGVILIDMNNGCGCGIGDKDN